MQKGERSAGLRCCHPSRVNDEDWIDLPSSFLLFLLANFPSKNKTILFPLLLQSFFHEELHFCFNSSLSLPFFLTFQTQLKVMHTILHLMGVAVTVALTFQLGKDFSKNGDFFQSFLFYCGLIKMAWRVVIVAEIFHGGGGRGVFSYPSPLPKATGTLSKTGFMLRAK